jgi:hypothetical protein
MTVAVAAALAAQKNYFGQQYAGSTSDVVDTVLASACSEFLKRSQVWRVRDSITLIANQADYPMPFATTYVDAVPVLLCGCAYSTGQRLTLPMSLDLFYDRTGLPSNAILLPTNVLRVWPTPTAADAGKVIRAVVSLTTDLSGSPRTLPAELLPHLKIVVMFAEAEFLAMKNRPWSNQQRADFMLRRAVHLANGVKAVADGGRSVRNQVITPPRSGM